MTTMRERLGDKAEEFERNHSVALWKVLTDRKYVGNIDECIDMHTFNLFDTEITKEELIEMDNGIRSLYVDSRKLIGSKMKIISEYL